MGITDLSQLNDFYVNAAALELELPLRVDLQHDLRSRL
jgi:hypothetical protein